MSILKQQASSFSPNKQKRRTDQGNCFLSPILPPLEVSLQKHATSIAAGFLG